MNWISEFLCNGTQVVRVNGAQSAPAPVVSGIPQGTVLGPVLFVIYITSEGFFFADDTKIFHKDTSQEEALKLQSGIEALEDGSNKWLLHFHPNKCHILTLGKFENIMYTKHYKICNKEIEHVFNEKDLGVIIFRFRKKSVWRFFTTYCHICEPEKFPTIWKKYADKLPTEIEFKFNA